MPYLKEPEIKKVEEILLAKLSNPTKIKRISRKELFHEMQRIIPSLQDDQETPFCVDISNLINEGKIKGVYITRGRYGGIKLGQKPQKENDVDESSDEDSSETTVSPPNQNQEDKKEVQEQQNLTSEVLNKAKNSYLKSNHVVKCDWNNQKATHLLILSISNNDFLSNKDFKLNITLDHVLDLLKNVFLAVDATIENSNVKISIVSSEFKTDKLLYVQESYLDLLKRLAFFHLGGEYQI